MTFNHHHGRAGVGPALPFRIKRGDIVARSINVEINGQFVQKDSKNAGVMGEGNVATLHITCDDSWSGYGKRIVWRNANGENPVSVILFETDSAIADPLIYEVTIPAEPMALPGWCSFTIEGYSEVDGVHKVAMSVSDHLYVEQSDSYYKPAEPTPSQTQQVFEALGKTEKKVHASAIESRSWAVGGTGTRPGEDTDNSKYYAKSAEESAEIANDSKTLAEASAKEAERAAHSVSHMARLAESWAVGGTGTRHGEDTDNAKYWSALAQVAASGEKMLYVDSFGAVGDGTSDDTQAIQKAIDFAQDNNLRVLAFTPGRSYKITACLSVTKALSLYGCNAKLLSYVDSGHFLTFCGSLEPEIVLSENVYAQSGDESFVRISTVSPHSYSIGDRVILQSQRDALAEDSGIYWCGTSTKSTNTAQYAEVLTINQVVNGTTIQCTGSLVYPYYYANRDPDVDVSTNPVQREHSTIRRANFLTGFVIRDLTVECYGQGKTHQDNTMLLFACADATVENVRITQHGGHGRCFAMQNCLNTAWIDCVADASHTHYDDYMETHAIDNHFTFFSSWYCSAVRCASYHAGQSFDSTYAVAMDGLDYVRCPCLYPAVKNCMVHGSMDSAATNHSGSFGCSYENSRFVNFSRALAVRSPFSAVIGCFFSAKGTRDSSGDPCYAIDISEPTCFGTRIENCTINADRGILVAPYTSNLKNAPKQKKKSISIRGNTFFAIRDYAIYVDNVQNEWNYEAGDTSAAYTPFAVGKSDITIAGNAFFNCGKTSDSGSLLFFDNFTNGVSVINNRFSNCSSYYLINWTSRNTDFTISGNRFSGCSGVAGIPCRIDLDKEEPRNAALDANFCNRFTYTDNLSTDENFPAYNMAYGGVDIKRSNNKECGTLYSNFQSSAPTNVGWRGDLTPGNERIYLVLSGKQVYTASSGTFSPVDDNVRSLGWSGARWSQLYCAAGTINTSDRNQKTDIGDVPDEVLDAWGRVRYKRFLFSDAVEKKGEAARYHIGLIAQDIQDAFSASGLNAADYGLFCADTIVDETGQEKTVLGIRYSEALALECAYIRRRLDSSIFYQNI